MFDQTADQLRGQAASNARAPLDDEASVALDDEEVGFYEEAIPPFAEAQLESLYANVMTTLARFDIYDAAPKASTYVVRRGGAVRTLFLFRREHRHVQVYNEQISLDPRNITRFVERVFARYPSVDRVSFYAIDADTAAIPYPFRKFDCLEDVLLSLPTSVDDYDKRLSKNTRDSIRRRHNKLLRDYPSFRFDILGKDLVRPEQIREIVAFSRARMAAKQQSCYHTDQSTDKLIQLVQRYGVVGVARIDGRICGGVVGQRLGTHHYAQIAAHDPAMDEYGLGILCNYLSIREAIATGMEFYHFGWGRYEYKYRLLGENKPLYQIDIYRGQFQKGTDLLHLSKAVRAEKRRQFKLWMARVAQGEQPRDIRIAKALSCMRSIKRRLA